MLAALAAGCGIPISSGPHRLATADLPAALVQHQEKPPTTTPGQKPPNSKLLPVQIFLIVPFSGNLVPVYRSVSPPVTPQKVLDALEAGPLSVDYHAGYGSAVAQKSHLVALGSVKHGEATVRLDNQFTQLRGEAPVDELAQIVWSLTAAPLHVRSVRFVASDGVPIAVETATGSFVDRPVTRKDYMLRAAQA